MASFGIVTLQDACLNKIARNIKLYVHLKCSRPLEFLRRHFSNRLWESTAKHLQLNEDSDMEVLDFLINPYLTRLDLSDCYGDLIRIIADKLKANGNNVVFIAAESAMFLSKQLMTSLPHLEHIKFGGCEEAHEPDDDDDVPGFVSKVVWWIGRFCPALKVLEFRDRDILHFKKGRDVYDFLHHSLSYDALSYLLDRCASLEVLHNIKAAEVLCKKHRLDFGKNKLLELKKYSLTSLSFCGDKKYPVVNAIEICSVLCPNISHIRLYDLKKDSLLKCTRFNCLKDVMLNSGYITSDNINEFLKLKGSQLVNLELYFVSVSVRSIIEYCPKLASLTLFMSHKKRQLQTFDINYFPPESSLFNLKSLTLGGIMFSDPHSAEAFRLIISVARNLQNLTLKYCYEVYQNFWEEMLRLGLHNLSKLTLFETDITIPTVNAS